MAEGNQPLPLSYRFELLQPMLADLRAGECCSLIGTSGTGKSNLALFLQRHDVQKHYWNDERTWVILMHSLIFEQNAEFAFTESMIHGLIEEADSHDFSAEFLEWANNLYDRLLKNPSAYLAFRTLQDLCRRLCEKDGLQLIFIFDQFENIWQSLDAHFFLNLRGLRDRFKYQVVYLVMTRDRLQRIRPDAQAVESFWELFSAHTHGLGPYSERDASTAVERLSSRTNIKMDDVSHEIVRLSGGHPGILRAIFWAFRDSPRKSFNIDELLQISSVCEECEKVWNALSPAEQHFSQIIVRGLQVQHPSVEIFNEMRLKEIVRDDPPLLVSPVLTAYVLKMKRSDLLGVVVDVSLRQIRLDGQALHQTLTPLEFKLLEYLARHVGIVCKREDLLHALYGEDYYDKNDQRLYAILTRLREALGEDAHNPRYLFTRRGGGIQLMQGGIVNARTD